MRPNRSIPDTTVIPELAYNDVVTAAKWLCDTFGFQKRLQIGNHRIQLLVGTGAIVVTERAPSLRQVDFAHSVLVRVENVDQHCTTAMAAGAQVIRQPQSYPFGERQYTVEDFEGHIWTFSQTIDDIDPASWEGFYTGSNPDLSTNQLLELVSSLKRSWRLFYVPVETLFSQMAYKRAAVEWLSRRNYPVERESPTYKQSCNPS